MGDSDIVEEDDQRHIRRRRSLRACSAVQRGRPAIPCLRPGDRRRLRRPASRPTRPPAPLGASRAASPARRHAGEDGEDPLADIVLESELPDATSRPTGRVPSSAACFPAAEDSTRSPPAPRRGRHHARSLRRCAAIPTSRRPRAAPRGVHVAWTDRAAVASLVRAGAEPAGRQVESCRSAGAAAVQGEGILSLREIINRKEKDVLDLRDALDAKERQILDHKDRVREHERARRDLEEKMLGFEKNLVAANERVTALSHDKEKSIERERGLKAASTTR